MWLSNNQNTILQPAALGAKKKKIEKKNETAPASEKRGREKIFFKKRQKTFAVSLALCA